jgi:transposase-like protein
LVSRVIGGWPLTCSRFSGRFRCGDHAAEDAAVKVFVFERGPVKPGLSSDERAELVRLRRENRTQTMELEILKRASAYFARENVFPK